MSARRKSDVSRTPKELRAWVRKQRSAGKRIGFVPTMGALHEGHLSLVAEALKHADVIVASIFVNPTQFAPNEDFDSYPRAEDSDLEKLASAGCVMAYCPSARDMYPEGDSTSVNVDGITSVLEGEYRPHFFGGVTSIVSRLFIHVDPDVAVFGEKDYQQLLVIRRMTRDLGLPVDVIGAATKREPDGLAMSSRNQYLSQEQRARAAGFAQALETAADAIANGVSISGALAQAYAAIDAAGLSPIDYVAVCDADTLDDLGDGELEPGIRARILAAAYMGKTRLIDNRPIQRIIPTRN